MSTRARRRLRVGMLASAVTGLTVVGHAGADGHLPGAVGMAEVALLAVGLASAAAGRRLRALPVLGLLLVGQLLAHVVLSVTAHHASAGSSPGVMVAAHVVAAVAATLVLVHADRLVDRWLGLWSTLLGVTAAVVGIPSARAVAPVVTGRSCTPSTLRHALVRRGPPVVVLAT